MLSCLKGMLDINSTHTISTGYKKGLVNKVMVKFLKTISKYGSINYIAYINMYTMTIYCEKNFVARALNRIITQL